MGEVGLHRKGGFRQVQRVFVVHKGLNANTHPCSRQESGPPAEQRERGDALTADGSAGLRRQRDDAAAAVDGDHELVQEVAAQKAVGPRPQPGIVRDHHERPDARAVDLDALHAHREHAGLTGDAADRSARCVAIAHPERGQGRGADDGGLRTRVEDQLGCAAPVDPGVHHDRPARRELDAGHPARNRVGGGIARRRSRRGGRIGRADRHRPPAELGRDALNALGESHLAALVGPAIDLGGDGRGESQDDTHRRDGGGQGGPATRRRVHESSIRWRLFSPPAVRAPVELSRARLARLPPPAPDALVDHHLVRSGDRVVVEVHAVHRLEAVGHGRDGRKPGGKHDQVVGTLLIQIAQDPGLAAAAVTQDARGHQPHHVDDLAAGEIGDGPDVVQGQARPGIGLRGNPAPDVHLHGLDVLDRPGMARGRRRQGPEHADQQGEAGETPHRRAGAPAARRVLRRRRWCAGRRRPEAGQRRDRDHERQGQQVDGVAALLEARAPVGREQRHRDRMREQRARRHERGAAHAPAERHEAGQQEDGQRHVDAPEPGGPLAEIVARPAEQCGGEGLPHAAQRAQQAALDLGRCAPGQEASDRGHVEHDPRQQAGRDGDEPPEGTAPGQRPGEPAEGHQQERLGPRERGEAQGDRGGRLAPVRAEHQAPGHEQRRERDLHAGERAPQHRPGQRGEDRGQQRQLLTPGPPVREAAGEPRGGERAADPEGLGQRGIRPSERERSAQQQGPEWRGGSRDRLARVVGEAPPLGQVPGELHMDPRVVQREGAEADGARDPVRPPEEDGQPEGQRHARGAEGARPHRAARSKV